MAKCHICVKMVGEITHPCSARNARYIWRKLAFEKYYILGIYQQSGSNSLACHVLLINARKAQSGGRAARTLCSCADDSYAHRHERGVEVKRPLFPYAEALFLARCSSAKASVIFHHIERNATVAPPHVAAVVLSRSINASAVAAHRCGLPLFMRDHRGIGDAHAASSSGVEHYFDAAREAAASSFLPSQQLIIDSTLLATRRHRRPDIAGALALFW